MNEFNMYPYVGVTNNTGNYQALPFIDCNNATQFVPVIYIKSYNETLILNENNCIYLYASDGFEFNAILDRIRYGLYDVKLMAKSKIPKIEIVMPNIETIFLESFIASLSIRDNPIFVRYNAIMPPWTSHFFLVLKNITRTIL